ncbi:MAG: TauD/TfdA family dioxygenase [Gammaproteobacteria bacterium]|nr:TauD/TfdA family dioxygenase [Gammaproteobacteria bacterium]
MSSDLEKEAAMSAAKGHDGSTIRVGDLPGARFGAVITGLDPSRISAADEALIWDTYRQRHGLICFDFDQMLQPEELHALTAVFGENEFAPGKINGIGKRANGTEQDLSIEEQVEALRAGGDDPYMAYIGNMDRGGQQTRTVDKKFFGEWEWHSDMSYIAVPPTFSLLHARVIPTQGGDTSFCSQVMAARELPASLRERLGGLMIKHDSTYGSSGQLRPGMTPPDSPVDAIGHAHPILRRVPTTGEEAMFLGRRTNGYVVGLPLAESEALLDELWAHATQPQFCYRHRWTVGQVVVWDNRMLLHKRHPMDVDDARLMWRTQTRGEAVQAVDG